MLIPDGRTDSMSLSRFKLTLANEYLSPFLSQTASIAFNIYGEKKRISRAFKFVLNA
jgi:hypothetical protein